MRFKKLEMQHDILDDWIIRQMFRGHSIGLIQCRLKDSFIEARLPITGLAEYEKMQSQHFMSNKENIIGKRYYNIYIDRNPDKFVRNKQPIEMSEDERDAVDYIFFLVRNHVLRLIYSKYWYIQRIRITIIASFLLTVAVTSVITLSILCSDELRSNLLWYLTYLIMPLISYASISGSIDYTRSNAAYTAEVLTKEIKHDMADQYGSIYRTK